MDALTSLVIAGSIGIVLLGIANLFAKYLKLPGETGKSSRSRKNTMKYLLVLLLPLIISFLMSSCVSDPKISGSGDSDHSIVTSQNNEFTTGTRHNLTNEGAGDESVSDLNDESVDSSSSIPDDAKSETESGKSSSQLNEDNVSYSSESDETGSRETAAATGEALEVHFLDVGQGASVFFRQGDHSMILDGGDRHASSFVVAYLKKLGIQNIDVMIATHYDADHINGLIGVLNSFPVDVVYSADYVATTKVYSSFKSAIASRADREIVPKIGQAFDLGDMHVTFIAPREYGHSDVNDDSISIRVDFGQTSFIIMGDQSANAEQQILNRVNLDADVFYSSHHGSNGSNSKTLLDAVSPKWTVISSGSNNSYGHPGQNTLNRIEKSGSKLFRTDQQGTIIIKSDGRNYEWSTAPSNDFAGASGQTTDEATVIPRPTTVPVAPVPTSTSKPAAVSPPPVVTTKAPATPAPETVPTTTAASDEWVVPAGTTYVLNHNSKKFHTTTCHHAKRISAENRIFSKDIRDTVIEMGYEPCGTCHP